MMGRPVVRRLVRIGVAVGSLAALSACARGRVIDPVQPQATAVAESHVQTGDRLFVHIWGEEKLSDTVLVDSRGQVSLPKVGLLNVTNTPILTLRDTIQTRFAKYFRDPAVEVVALRRIAVNGAVSKPNVYYVDIATSLRDAIALAGGITENGNPKRVSVVRGTEEIPIPNWQRDQTMIGQLRSGDQVVVGRRSWLQTNALQVASLGLVVASFVLSLRR
jgi:polysaccharide export outer membrane protein